MALKDSDVVLSHGLSVFSVNESLHVIGLDSSGEISIRIIIQSNFAVSARKYHTCVPVRDLLGFQPTLKFWSQVGEIVLRCKYAPVSVVSEIEGSFSTLTSRLNSEGLIINDGRLQFLVSQIQLAMENSSSRRYDMATIRKCALVYLISSSAYSQLKEVLFLPNEKTLRSRLAGLGNVGTENDSEEVLQSIIQELHEGQRLFALLFDEMYVKPSVRYRCKHVIGYAVDNPDKLARTILAIMAKPLMGGKPFILRLLPVYQLTPTFLKEHLGSCIGLINKHGGQVVALISDNHPSNRKCFHLFEDPTLSKPWIGRHSSQEKHFYLMNDFVHLFKSIRNNWQTEKTGTMAINDLNTNKRIQAKWDHVVKIYRSEENNVVRRTNLTYEACFPSSIQKTNVNLALQVRKCIKMV